MAGLVPKPRAEAPAEEKELCAEMLRFDRVLEPAGTNGTTFVVTYKPTEYGKPVQGKLIIQTEETPFIVRECKDEKHAATYWIKMDEV
eukprot:s1865_g20.t1